MLMLPKWQLVSSPAILPNATQLPDFARNFLLQHQQHSTGHNNGRHPSTVWCTFQALWAPGLPQYIFKPWPSKPAASTYTLNIHKAMQVLNMFTCTHDSAPHENRMAKTKTKTKKKQQKKRKRNQHCITGCLLVLKTVAFKQLLHGIDMSQGTRSPPPPAAVLAGPTGSLVHAPRGLPAELLHHVNSGWWAGEKKTGSSKY